MSALYPSACIFLLKSWKLNLIHEDGRKQASNYKAVYMVYG